jgi:pyruvate dehydrogenase E2 component (dihydrolipoamide acetyltransferase)
VSAGKRREIEYLSSVARNGLVSTLYITINVKKVIKVLNQKLSFLRDSILPVILLESSRLLVKYPLLNAFFDNDQIGNIPSVNIGIAMDIDDGLKVVKFPDTDKMGIFEIEEMILELSNRYLDKKLSVKELTEITFTVTDISNTGISFFAPLINKNNSAILGIAKADNSGNCLMSLSFDHRVTEGKYAGNFLADLKVRIESFSFESEDDTVSTEVCYKCFKELSEDLNEKGFIKVQTSKGEEKLICDTCLFNY